MAPKSQRRTGLYLRLLIFTFLATPLLSAQADRTQDRRREADVREQVELREIEAGLGSLTDETLQDFEFDYGGWVRGSYYQFKDYIKRRAYRIYDMRLWSNVVYKDTHQLYMRVFGNLTDYDPGDEYFYEEEQDLDIPRLDVGYYYGDLGKVLSLNLPVSGKLRAKAGRQYVTIGQGLVLDVRGDGLMLEYKSDAADLTAFGVRSIYSENGYDQSYPDFGHSKNFFSGLEGVKKFGKELELYGYAVWMEDKRRSEWDHLTQKFEYDSHYLGGGVRGLLGSSLSYYGEYTIEGGRSYSDGTDEKADIDAFAYDLGVTYTFIESRLEPKLSVQRVVGSGDSDTGVTTDMIGGNTAGTDNNAFFSYGYINTGFSFFPLISNIEIWRLGIEITPFKNHEVLGDLDVGVNYFNYSKHKSKGGTADRGIDTTVATSSLGHETDFYLTWRPFSDVSIITQYGLFSPDSDAFVTDWKRAYVSTGVIIYF